MIDRSPLPLPSSLPARGRRIWSRHLRGALLPIGLSTALAVSTAISSPGIALAAEGPQVTGPSIQYQEAVSHASQEYAFTPGGVVNVPFRPRPGDSTQVDGAAPIALPAGQGSNVAAPDVAEPGPVAPNGTANVLRREVLGFLPYWELGTTLDYDSLSTIAYFGTDLKLDGTLNTSSNGWNGWVSSTMTSLINNAHAHGTRVALTIQSFAWDGAGAAAQTTILSDPAIRLTAAQQIAAEVGRRGADGVNLDFEPIASGQYSNFVTFTRLLRSELDKVHPGYELTFCATGAPGTYDLPNLLAAGAADAVFIMGYDLRGGSPANTGSIDPLESPYIRYDLTYVVGTFRSQVAASKIILGLPWYGHAWSTGAVNTVYAPTVDLATFGQPATGITYSSAMDLAATIGNGKQYDSVEQTAWTAYYGNYGGTQNSWRELYFDDAQALGAKCDAIDGWDLRGVGIWALGYDNNGGNGDLTRTIAAKFEIAQVSATYVPLAPTRLLDTRVGNGLGGKLLANTPATFQVAGRGGVPAAAVAVTGNLTAVDESAGYAMYIGPISTPSPTTASLNFSAGQATGNGLTVGLSATGTLSVTYMATSGNTTNAVLDVTGYFLPGASGATYVPLTPIRLLDTRVGNGLGGKLLANTPATFQVAGRGGVPAAATAVTGNVTVVNSSSSWAVYLGPDPAPKPTTSTINFSAGQVAGNGLTVALSTTGALSATYMSTGGNTTDLVFDVTGYFMPGMSGAVFHPMAPVRLLDTRAGNGLGNKLVANGPATFQVTVRGGVPPSAIAVTGRLTVVNETNSWAVYLGPDANPNPTTSTINFSKGDVKGNSLDVALSPSGYLSATYMSTSGNTTDLVFDVTGYFGP